MNESRETLFRHPGTPSLSLNLILNLLLSLLLFLSLPATTAHAHPGPVGSDGCHVCRKQCDRWGLASGERHCHPERLKSPAKQKTRKQKAPAPPVAAWVEKVVDGDTVQVRLGGEGKRVTVRVLGIDCPESHRNAKCRRDGVQGRETCDQQVPRGLEAARRVAELVKQQRVILEGSSDKDPYGRLLAYIRLPDGRDLGEILIMEGLCEDFSWKYPHPRQDRYKGIVSRP
jgi:endonuclease YncB( thermonuclease family)